MTEKYIFCLINNRNCLKNNEILSKKYFMNSKYSPLTECTVRYEKAYQIALYVAD